MPAQKTKIVQKRHTFTFGMAALCEKGTRLSTKQTLFKKGTHALHLAWLPKKQTLCKQGTRLSKKAHVCQKTNVVQKRHTCFTFGMAVKKTNAVQKKHTSVKRTNVVQKNTHALHFAKNTNNAQTRNTAIRTGPQKEARQRF
jgi:hypothetical protein